MTIVETGGCRVKGYVNENNASVLTEGAAVVIRSRVSDQTWKGTIDSIDWNNAQQKRSDYGDSDTAMSSRYPFYVTLDGGGEGLGNRLYQASRTGSTLEAVLAAAKTKRYPMARLRRMVLAAWLDLPAPPERAPYLRVLAANDTGRRLLRQMRDAGAPVLTKPADVFLLGAEAEALFVVESRCTDLYALARPDPAQMTPGQEWRMTPVMR